MTKTHCMSKTPEWNTWNDMRRRCRDPKRPQAKWYRARGIKVCERWESFENFYADMGSKPSPEHSIERNDNDGDYEPSNCRWATKVEQCLNYRRNRIVTAFGKSAPLGAFISFKQYPRAYKQAWAHINRGCDAEASIKLAMSNERGARQCQ